jgi:hypothetical protein
MLGLKAEWDGPTHGNILNVPFYDADLPESRTKDEIEALLDELARCSKLVPDEDYERALADKHTRTGR